MAAWCQSLRACPISINIDVLPISPVLFFFIEVDPWIGTFLKNLWTITISKTFWSPLGYETLNYFFIIGFYFLSRIVIIELWNIETYQPRGSYSHPNSSSSCKENKNYFEVGNTGCVCSRIPFKLTQFLMNKWRN